ncbi:MAG TPA: 16S rRNA (uracil(1498)-N(3))-methyltransferase [Acidimicrobiia bacterium]|nr:16S rRNA (uracil(1498)-N(3))-methyltransferase [Acidimicrobiia bacterium]
MAHVPHVYLPGPWQDAILPLDDPAHRHLRRVLRRADGDPVSYTDGTGTVGEGTLRGAAVVRGSEQAEPRRRALSMAVAPPSHKDRVRFLVEKLAELGVAELRWLATRFGEGRPPDPAKVHTWCRSALEQSRSAWLMSVDPEPVAIGDLPGGTVFADIAGVHPSQLQGVTWVAVGPEGGWATGELPADARTVSFGREVLRVETAAMVAAASGSLQLFRNGDHGEW